MNEYGYARVFSGGKIVHDTIFPALNPKTKSIVGQVVVWNCKPCMITSFDGCHVTMKRLSDYQAVMDGKKLLKVHIGDIS